MHFDTGLLRPSRQKDHWKNRYMHEPRDADPFFAEIPLSLSSPESFSISLSFLFDYLFLDPPGVCLNKKNSFVLCGWRVGRNPPSVPSSICLIGEPAPPAELIGVYIPFHSAMGARFIPRPALHPGRPGEHPIIVTRYRDGYRFCAPTQALA